MARLKRQARKTKRWTFYYETVEDGYTWYADGNFKLPQQSKFYKELVIEFHKNEDIRAYGYKLAE